MALVCIKVPVTLQQDNVHFIFSFSEKCYYGHAGSFPSAESPPGGDCLQLALLDKSDNLLLALLQASNVARSQDVQSRAARRLTRNQRRKQALSGDIDAEASSSDSDFSLKEVESDQERDDFISNAAAAIAGCDSCLNPSGGQGTCLRTCL